MTNTILSARTFALLLFAGLPAYAGTFTYSPFTSDKDSGISSAQTYTTAVDFAGTGSRVVNGVPFAETSDVGANYSLTGAGAIFNTNTNNVTGVSNEVLTDFRYTGDGSGNASLTLSGLTVGQRYVTSWYNAAFGGAGARNVTITASDTNSSIFFDENYTGDKNGNVLRYTFVATAPTITYAFDADGNGDSFHHYAMTNAVANNSLLSTPIINAATGAGPGYAPFAVRNDDLLQTRLANVVSSGNFGQEGAGGTPILNNGTFAINGGNPTDNSQLATGGNDAFVEFTLDLTVNPRGYDISSIETYGGWNDSGRDRQLFKISYSLVGSSDFVHLGSLDFNPQVTSTPSAVQAIFNTALTGVDAIRFDFFGGQENGYAGYGEFDVVGTPTVPEPASTGVALVGGLGLLLQRRRRNVGVSR